MTVYLWDAAGPAASWSGISGSFPLFRGFAACAFFFLRFCAGVLITSSGLRGTGTAS